MSPSENILWINVVFDPHSGRINDTISDADRLIDLIGDLPCKVNVIPYNEIEGPFKRPSEKRINKFVKQINNSKFNVTVRWSKGTDINSGCGQLAVLES